MSGVIQSQQACLKYFDHGRAVYAVDSATLTIEPGEFLGILGPSGSGKSSLLYILSGLKQTTEGSVTYQGAPYSSLNDAERSQVRLKNFGFVFQQPYLLGYLSALENVAVAERGTIEEALELLNNLGLGEKLHRLPHELSGGERQRVCVARALIGSPAIIFADEPTASLDHKNGLAVVELLNQHRAGGALVMVTHDPTMLKAADRIVHIEDGKLQELDFESKFQTEGSHN